MTGELYARKRARTVRWGADGKGHLLYLASGLPDTVLSEFRSRLVEGRAEQRLLDLLLERCQEGGWLKARGRQRTDSTHILAKIRALNRVLCVAQTMVYVLNVLSEVAPEWVRAYVPAEWVERYGERLEHERLLKARRKSGSTLPIRWEPTAGLSCMRWMLPARRTG